jgi:hypothetical protein
VPRISLPTAAAIAGTAGAGISAIGAISGGLSTAAEARYQAQVASNNAAIANQNAAYSAAAGSAKAAAGSRKNAAVLGRIKAAQGANQIDVNTGSAADVQKSQRETGMLDTLTTENNALLQAYGYRSQATSYTAQSGLESAEAAQAPIGAAIGAAGGLLGNASSIGYKYNWFTGGGNTGGGLSGPGTD